MGNTPGTLDMRHGHLYPSQGSNLKKLQSDDDYIPMSREMRKSLVKAKFCQVVPLEKESCTDCLEKVSDHSKTDSLPDRVEEVKRVVNYDEEENKKVSTACLKTQGSETSNGFNNKEITRCEPVVTVLNVAAVQEPPAQRISRQTLAFPSEQSSSAREYKPCKKSPNRTNRTYSLLNLRTDSKKSKFTLELEEKLRQSKFNLGFDADLDDWKELSYTMDNSECRRRLESLPKVKMFDEANYVGQGLEKVCLKYPLQYFNNDCQILGLCSVRQEPFKKKETENTNVMKEVKKCIKHDSLKSHVEGNTKDLCSCEQCTLAFLTETKYPEHNEDKQLVPRNRSQNSSLIRGSISKSPKREVIKVFRPNSSRKSVEVSVGNVSEKYSMTQSLLSNVSSQSGSVSDKLGDTTNKRIRQSFRKTKRKVCPVRELYKHPMSLASDLNPLTGTSPRQSYPPSVRSEPPLEMSFQVQRADLQENPSIHRIAAHHDRSSLSTLGASVSSSLSSVMSYHRVREIFMSIIEKNRGRRKPRRNINKFKEMEELGLGEVKNNRWYPSDSRAFTIWRDLNQNVGGLKAEFRKYPKNYS